MNIGLIPSVNIFNRTELAFYTARQFFPLGLLYLIPILERAGHDVFLYDISGMMQSENRNLDSELYGEIIDRAVDDDVDVLGFSTMPNTFSASIRMAELFKEKRSDAAVVFGGSQATICAGDALTAIDAVDAVVAGEAELTIVDLIDALGGSKRLTDIGGVSCRVNGSIFQNPERPYVQHLDDLPIPAYDRITPLDGAVEFPVETHRGCPYRCTYCCIHKISPRRVRWKSNERIIQEMEHIKNTFKPKRIGFISDHFMSRPKKIRDLCTMMVDKELNVTWGCDTRVDSLDESMITLMREAGCVEVLYGIETGSARMQKHIKKNLDLPRAEQMIDATVSRGIGVQAAYIVGFPDETPDELEETIDMVFRIRVVGAKVGVATLMPLLGSDIFEECRDRIYLNERFDVLLPSHDFDDREKDLIARYPNMFSALYSVRTTAFPTDHTASISFFIMSTGKPYPITMLALKKLGGLDFLKIFARWFEVFRDTVTHANMKRTEFFTDYSESLLDFLRSLIRELPHRHLLEDILDYEHQRYMTSRKVIQFRLEQKSGEDEPKQSSIMPDAKRWKPRLCPTTSLAKFDYGVHTAARRLLTDEARSMKKEPCYIVFFVSDSGKVGQLVISERLWRLLHSSDGRNDASTLLTQFGFDSTNNELLSKLSHMNVVG